MDLVYAHEHSSGCTILQKAPAVCPTQFPQSIHTYATLKPWSQHSYEPKTTCGSRVNPNAPFKFAKFDKIKMEDSAKSHSRHMPRLAKSVQLRCCVVSLRQIS